MKGILTAIIVAFLCLPSLSSSASSQLAQPSAQLTSGKILGAVLDVNDARVTRARIKIESKSFKWEGVSDEAGDFMAEVPPETYRIYVEANGFRKFESAYLKVKPGITEMVNLHLEVETFINTVEIGPKKKT